MVQKESWHSIGLWTILLLMCYESLQTDHHMFLNHFLLEGFLCFFQRLYAEEEFSGLKPRRTILNAFPFPFLNAAEWLRKGMTPWTNVTIPLWGWENSMGSPEGNLILCFICVSLWLIFCSWHFEVYRAWGEREKGFAVVKERVFQLFRIQSQCFVSLLQKAFNRPLIGHRNGH